MIGALAGVLPAGLPLMLGALAGLGMAARRRSGARKDS